MPQQKDLVKLILNLSAHKNKGTHNLIQRKDEEIEKAVSQLVAHAEEAVSLLIEALDYAAFYKNYAALSGPWSDFVRLQTLLLGGENVNKTLIKIGDKAKPDLMKRIEDANDTIKYGSLQCLIAMGEAKTILQDKIKDGSFAYPSFIPTLSLILERRPTLPDILEGRSRLRWVFNGEVRQMAYEAILTIREKYPRKSTPYLKEHFNTIVKGVYNPVQMLEIEPHIFTKEELAVQKLWRSKQEKRRAVAIELAQTKTKEAVKALIQMADGMYIYPRTRWHLFWRSVNVYSLNNQLDAIDALGETGSQKALLYLQRLAKYRKSKRHEKAQYRDGSLAWEEIRGSVLFPHAKRELKKRLETRTITLETLAGPRYTGTLPSPNWAENYLARNDNYQRILSSAEKLKRGLQAN